MVTQYDRERRCGRFSVEWCGGGAGNREAFLPFKALLVPPSLLRCYWPEKGTLWRANLVFGGNLQRGRWQAVCLNWSGGENQIKVRSGRQKVHAVTSCRWQKKAAHFNYISIEDIWKKVKHLNNLSDTDVIPFHLIWLYFKGGSDEQIMVAKQEGALIRKMLNSPK